MFKRSLILVIWFVVTTAPADASLGCFIGRIKSALKLNSVTTVAVVAPEVRRAVVRTPVRVEKTEAAAPLADLSSADLRKARLEAYVPTATSELAVNPVEKPKYDSPAPGLAGDYYHPDAVAERQKNFSAAYGEESPKVVFQIKELVAKNKTNHYRKWFESLDPRDRARIESRIENVKVGNFGDAKNLGGGIWELRIFTRNGFRVYFSKNSSNELTLLMGGDKDTQGEDIALARKLLAESAKP